MSLKDEVSKILEQGAAGAADRGKTVTSPGVEEPGQKPDLGEIGVRGVEGGEPSEEVPSEVSVSGDIADLAGKRSGGDVYSPVKGAGEIAGGSVASQELPGADELTPRKSVRVRGTRDARSSAPEREPSPPLGESDGLRSLVSRAVDEVLSGEDPKAVARRLLRWAGGDF